MTEENMFEVTLEHKNGRVRRIIMSESQVDYMYDKLWGRDKVMWLDVWGEIVNLDDIRYIRYIEIEEEE